MKRFGGVGRWLLLAAAAIGLSGCVNLVADPLKEQAKTDESPVVVSVTSNTGQVVAFDSLMLKRTNPTGNDPRTSYLLRQVSERTLYQNTAVFIGNLPAGTYEVDQLTSGGVYVSFKDSVRQLLGPFTVKQGQPVDLGKIILTPFVYENRVTSVLIGRSKRSTSNLPLLRQALPQYLALFSGKSATGWDAEHNTNDTVEEYALSRPVGLFSPVMDKEGSILAASRMGSVLVRKEWGQWGSITSDRVESLSFLSLVDSPDMRLIAAGEHNTLLKLTRTGKALVSMSSGDLPTGNILYVGGDDSSGWYIAQIKGSTFSIYQSAQLENGKWRLVHTTPVPMALVPHIWTWKSSKGMGFAFPGDTAMHFIDFKTREVTARKFPDDQRMHGFAPQEGAIGLLSTSGFFAEWRAYLTEDEGLSWQRMNVNSKETPIHSAPKKIGNKIYIGGGILYGIWNKAPLIVSEDNGKTWKEKTEDLDRMVLVAVSPSNLLAVSNWISGLFYIRNSWNEGESWRTEYSNFNPNVKK